MRDAVAPAGSQASEVEPRTCLRELLPSGRQAARRGFSSHWGKWWLQEAQRLGAPQEWG